VDSLSWLSIFDAHNDNAMHGEGSFATTFGIGPWESEMQLLSLVFDVFLKVQWHPCPSIYDQVCSLESYVKPWDQVYEEYFGIIFPKKIVHK
jgi:hypothetical protein